VDQWHSFLTFAPAYDLTYPAGPGGEHYLDIEVATRVEEGL
jgi:hypothetical protein